MNILIVCDDGGEMKTVSLAELQAWADGQVNSHGNSSLLVDELDEALNAILDRRAFDAGEYDPSDNDTPMVFGAAVSCPGCNGTGDQGGNPSYGACDDCGGSGCIYVEEPR